MSIEPPDKSEPAPDERLAKLKQSIAHETSQRTTESGAAGKEGVGGGGNNLAMSAGFRVATELVANVCVGGLVGWQLDKWTGWSPILLLVFLLLGVASGFWSVYRIAMRPTKPRS